MTAEWIDVKTALPAEDVLVLAVKQLKNGTRDVCLARCTHNHKYYDIDTNEYYTGPYWTCGGCNRIVCWTPLPDLPEKGEFNGKGS